VRQVAIEVLEEYTAQCATKWDDNREKE